MKGLAKDIVNVAKGKVIQSMKDNDRKATGDTFQQLTVEVSEQGNKVIATLKGPKHIEYLIRGRGATHTKEQWKANKGKKGAPLAPLIRWVKARNLSISPWAVKYKVDTEGYKGTPDLITSVINEKFISDQQERINEVVRLQINDVTKKFKDGIKRN